MLNKNPTFFLHFLLLWAVVFTIFGCANQQPPHGGPKDVTPPRLLKASPPNMTRHFNAKFVKLDFDEYFKLNNTYTEITMSPTPDKQPEFKRKDKSLVITLKDTLQKNTTYVINFGKAIQDVNEGNTLLNFTYVFSTGPHIDSLSVSGSVISSISQRREKDATVMLFPVEKDTAYFGKKKPNIYTTTDTAGNFSMNNLHEGEYRIYALKETTPNKIYDNEKELIGFLKKPVRLFSDTSDIQLTLFQQEPDKFRLAERQKFDFDGKMRFLFNKPLDNPSLKIIYPPALDAQKLVEITPTRDTAYLWSKNMDFDSIRVAILDDGKPIDSVSLEKGKKETFIQTFNFSYNLSSNYLLKPTNNLVITSNFPIDSYDESLITLTEDSTAVSNIIISKESLNQRKLIIKYHWKRYSKYSIRFDDGALTNIFGVKSKHAYKTFQPDKEENYSNLTLHVTVPDTTKSYIVELYVDPKYPLDKTEISKNTTLTYKNYLAQKYYIRVIYDDNRNGKWDTGNVKKREYPENIWNDPNEITLRPNFDIDDKLEIPREQYAP